MTLKTSLPTIAIHLWLKKNVLTPNLLLVWLATARKKTTANCWEFWDQASDELLVDLSELSGYVNHLPLTKQSVLKVSASLIFDLLGLVSPSVIRLKLTVCLDLCGMVHPKR